MTVALPLRAFSVVAVGIALGAALPPPVTAQAAPPSEQAQDNAPAAPGKSPAPTIGTVRELAQALRSCWEPPPLSRAHPGMQITIRLSFKRSGELIGPPAITYETANASQDERQSYRQAILDMLRRCTPMPITDELGASIAGRPFSLRFTDKRNLREI